MTTQVTIHANVVPADGLEIAGRLESHAQAARGALADRTCRALASDSRIWSAWCAERNVSALPAEPTTVVAFVDGQGEIKSPATIRRYVATIAHMHRAAELTDPTKAEVVRLACDMSCRGYLRSQFETAWCAYCPSADTPTQPSKIISLPRR
jgi:hypothetical protein